MAWLTPPEYMTVRPSTDVQYVLEELDHFAFGDRQACLQHEFHWAGRCAYDSIAERQDVIYKASILHGSLGSITLQSRKQCCQRLSSPVMEA